MSGNIHFDVTGSNADFKRIMQDTRREIQDTENEANDALDEIFERLHENTKSGDLFGLKDAVADGKIQLEVLRETIGKVSDAIEGMTSESEKQAAVEVVDELKERYDQLAESVEEGEAALKAMRRALISGGVALGVAAAAAVALVVVIRSVTKECREMNAAIEAGFASAKGQAAQWLADFSKAQALWKSAQGDVERLNTILRDNKDILEASGIAINDINEGNQAFIDNSDAMVDALKKRAVALAFEQAAATAAGMAADEYLKAEEKIAKRENRRVNSPIVRFFNRLNYEGVEGGEEWDYQRMAQNDRDAAEKSAETRLKMVQKLSEASVDAWKEYEDALAALGLTTSGATNKEKEHQQALEDTIAKLQKYADAVAKLREQQALATGRQNVQLQNRIEQAEIDAMQDGYEKQKRQREFNDRKALADIEASKEEYVRAYRERERAIWEAQEEAIALQDENYVKKQCDPSKVIPDTSAFDALYRAITEKQENELIIPLLSQYQTYEDKVKEITSRGQAEVSALLSKGYKKQAALRREAMKSELTQLKDQYDQTFQLIFRDPALMNIAQIQEAIDTAQKKIAELSSTPESQQANIQYIETLRQAIERLKGASSDFSAAGILNMLFSSDKETGQKASLAERVAALKDAWANMSDEDKWRNVGGWVSGIAQSLQHAAASMKEIAETSGDGRLADAAEQLSSVAQNFAAAGGGAATGGWIGAIVGGATDMIAQTLQAFTETKVAEAENVRNAKEWAQALRNVNVEMQEISETFGERQLAKGREGMRSSVEAMRRYHEELADLNKKYNEQEIETYTYASKGVNTFLNPLGWLQKGEFNNEWLAYINAINKGYEGLQRMLVKTTDRSGWANFWGAQDKYTALADLYPELFKDGELVVENAKKLLEVNNKLTDTQRQEIENVIKLKEAYDEAVQAVDDSINSIFGSIASDVTDIIWDSVVNGGGDAWARFRELGSDAVAAIGKQLIQEMVISEYLEQFRQQMRDAYTLGSAADTQASLRSIVADIFDGMGMMLQAGSAVAQEYQEWAQEHGFDLSGAGEDSRRSVAKAMTSVSQESWDVVDGKITNIMMHLLDIDDRFSVVQDVQLRMLERVTEISGHTARLERVDNNISALRSEIEDIRTRGVKIAQI